MRFYTQSHTYYCGIDLHSRWMYVCIVDDSGEVLYHKNHRCRAEELAKALAAYRSDVVVCVECLFTWYWIADWCSDHDIEFVLGHALEMKAIHGSKTKHDRIDSEKIARLLKAGLIPQSYVYPSKLRATRDLLRRRIKFVRLRAELTAHITMTKDQYNLAPLPGRVQSLRHRPNIADHFADPQVRHNVQTDLDVIAHLDRQIRLLESHLLKQANADFGVPFRLLKTVPGIGDVLALVILYEIGDLHRFDSRQQFVSYSRLTRGDKESAGKKTGQGNAKMGNAYLKWAFSEAAVLFLQKQPHAQANMNRLRSRHGRGKALSILAHKLGRSVYTMLKKQEAFDADAFMMSF